MCEPTAPGWRATIPALHPAPGSPAGGTVVVLADCAACVHRVRALLAAHGFVAAAPRAEPDLAVVVCDDPAAAAAMIAASARTRTATPHLVLTSGPVDAATALAVVRAGADGCLPADLPERAMGAALTGLVLRGEVALPRSVLSAVLAEVRLRPGRTVRRDDGRAVELTEREWQVLDLLASGCSTREAARRMHVGEATVRGYLRTAAVRLRASDRADALRVFRGERVALPTPRTPVDPTRSLAG